MTVLGLLTLLLGLAYAVLGGIFLFFGVAAQKRLEGDPAGGLGFLLELIAGFVAVVGVAFLVQGVLGVAGGLGLLFRKPWGRIPTFLLAVLALLWGVLCYATYGLDVTGIVIGSVQVLYGIFAVVTLFKSGAPAPGGVS